MRPVSGRGEADSSPRRVSLVSAGGAGLRCGRPRCRSPHRGGTIMPWPISRGRPMPITQSLSALALRHLLPPAGEAAALLAAGETADRVVGALVAHLSDHSQKLPEALRRACRSAWKALELALAGDSWWQ